MEMFFRTIFISFWQNFTICYPKMRIKLKIKINKNEDKKKNVPQIFLGNKRKYAMNSNILLNGKSDNKNEFNVPKCVNSKTKTFNDIIEILDSDDSNDNYGKKSQNNVFNSNHNNNNSNNSNDSNYNKSQNNDFNNIFKKEGHIAKKCFHLDDNNNNNNKNNFNNNKNIVNIDKNKNNNNTDYSKVFLNSNSKEIISNHALSFPLPSSLPREIEEHTSELQSRP